MGVPAPMPSALWSFSEVLRAGGSGRCKAPYPPHVAPQPHPLSWCQLCGWQETHQHRAGSSKRLRHKDTHIPALAHAPQATSLLGAPPLTLPSSPAA